MKKPTTAQEKQVGRKLLWELDELLNPGLDRGYVDFDKPRKDLWGAFRERWGDRKPSV